MAYSQICFRGYHILCVPPTMCGAELLSWLRCLLQRLAAPCSGQATHLLLTPCTPLLSRCEVTAHGGHDSRIPGLWLWKGWLGLGACSGRGCGGGFVGGWSFIIHLCTNPHLNAYDCDRHMQPMPACVQFCLLTLYTGHLGAPVFEDFLGQCTLLGS